MIIIYAPDGADVQRHHIVPGKLQSLEAEAIEDVGAAVWENFDGWEAKFRRGNKRAERAGLWICLRRTQPDLQFHDVSYATAELTVTYDDDEKRAMRANVRASTDLDDAAKQNLLDIIGEPAGGEDLTPLEPSGSPPAETATEPAEPSTGG